MITLNLKKEITKNQTVKRIVIQFINNHKYKLINQCFTANLSNLKLYPRFWLNKSISTPNFNHWSFTIRFFWWYFGIEKKFIDLEREFKCECK